MAARDLILDAADRVIRTEGVAKATTRRIAAEAGFSEALLYKHFADKHDLFLAVLHERTPDLPPWRELDEGTAVDRVTALTADVVEYYARAFPLAVALLGDGELLAGWRELMAAHPPGPHQPVAQVSDQLAAERDAGHVPPDLDPGAVAELLCGGALQHVFMESFGGASQASADVARRLVAGLRLAPQLSRVTG
jgi:AcrR family transcriptional regulator